MASITRQYRMSRGHTPKFWYGSYATYSLAMLRPSQEPADVLACRYEGLIETAQTVDLNGKAASEEAASLKNCTSSVKMVAGAGFGQEPTIRRAI